jgi:hypothetical protein
VSAGLGGGAGWGRLRDRGLDACVGAVLGDVVGEVAVGGLNAASSSAAVFIAGVSLAIMASTNRLAISFCRSRYSATRRLRSGVGDDRGVGASGDGVAVGVDADAFGGQGVHEGAFADHGVG